VGSDPLAGGQGTPQQHTQTCADLSCTHAPQCVRRGSWSSAVRGPGGVAVFSAIGMCSEQRIAEQAGRTAVESRQEVRRLHAGCGLCSHKGRHAGGLCTGGLCTADAML
jgi:hypothetical protein